MLIGIVKRSDKANIAFCVRRWTQTIAVDPQIDKQIEQSVFVGQDKPNSLEIQKPKPRGTKPYVPKYRIHDAPQKTTARQRLYRNELHVLKQRTVTNRLKDAPNPYEAFLILRKYSWALNHAHVGAGFNVLGRLATKQNRQIHRSFALQCQQILLEAIVRVQQTIGPWEVAQAVWSLGKWGFADTKSEGFACLMRLVRKNVLEMKYMDLSISFHGMAGVGWQSRADIHIETLETLANQVLLIQDQMHTQGIANITWACAKLGYANKVLLKDIGSLVAKKIDTFKSQELVNVVWGFAMLNLCHKVLMQTTMETCLQQLEDYSIVDLSSLVWAFVKLKMPAQKLLDALEEQLVFRYLGDLDKFPTSSLAQVAWGLSAAGRSSEHLFGLLAGIVKRNQHPYDCADLAQITWAFANVGRHDRQLFQGLSRYAVYKSSRLKLNELLMLIEAFSLIGHFNEYTFETLTFHVGDQIDQLSLKQLASYSSHVSNIRYIRPSLWNQVEDQLYNLLGGPYAKNFIQFKKQLRDAGSMQKMLRMFTKVPEDTRKMWEQSFQHILQVFGGLGSVGRWEFIFEAFDKLDVESQLFKCSDQDLTLEIVMCLEICSKQLIEQFGQEKYDQCRNYFKGLIANQQNKENQDKQESQLVEQTKDQVQDFERLEQIQEVVKYLGMECALRQKVGDYGHADILISLETVNFAFLLASQSDLIRDPSIKPKGMFNTNLQYLQNRGYNVIWVEKGWWDSLQSFDKKVEALQKLMQIQI